MVLHGKNGNKGVWEIIAGEFSKELATGLAMLKQVLPDLRQSVTCARVLRLLTRRINFTYSVIVKGDGFAWNETWNKGVRKIIAGKFSKG